MTLVQDWKRVFVGGVVKTLGGRTVRCRYLERRVWEGPGHQAHYEFRLPLVRGVA